MKFRKLLLCMLAGIFLAGFANIYTYAAEEDQNVTANTDATNETADTDITAVTDNTAATADTAAATDTTADVKYDAESTDTTASEETVTEDQTDKETAEKETASTTKTAKKTTAKAATAAKKTTEKKETVNYSKAELRLLSALIYCEAGGEAYNGKLAVGIVVMNRVRSSAFPDTVKGVIYQKYQFGPVTNGSLNKALAEYDAGKFTSQNEQGCIKAAKEALNGTKTITVSGKSKKFGSYLFFSGRLRGYTYKLGNHQFK